MWLTARKWGALPPHFQIRGAWAPLAPPVPPPMHYINLYWEPHISLSTSSTAVNGSRKKSSCIVQTGISAVGVHLLALKYSILQHKIKKFVVHLTIEGVCEEVFATGYEFIYMYDNTRFAALHNSWCVKVDSCVQHNKWKPCEPLSNNHACAPVMLVGWHLIYKVIYELQSLARM